jgi:integrase
MNTRYRLTYRGIRGGMFYCVDKQTGKRTSLHTTNEDDARQIVEAKNNAERQPILNLQIAKAYIAGTDSEINKRTWLTAIDALIETKHGANRERWLRVKKDKALATLLPRVIVETQSEHLLKVLQIGSVSTNVYLRRLHNFSLDMNWLPWPILPKKRWPEVVFKKKRAITWEEHCKIVEREKNAERKAFYQLAWHTGASQSDIAFLEAKNIDWERNAVSFTRKKTKTIAIVRFDDDLAEVMRSLPSEGPLFPYLRTVRAGDRATEFKQRCEGLGIKGVSLHSYRYSWAQRARQAGYPERFAMENLGHNSKAVHEAYAGLAQVEIPSLGDFVKKRAEFANAGKTQTAAMAQVVNA